MENNQEMTDYVKQIVKESNSPGQVLDMSCLETLIEKGHIEQAEYLLVQYYIPMKIGKVYLVIIIILKT